MAYADALAAVSVLIGAVAGFIIGIALMVFVTLPSVRAWLPDTRHRR